jgi:hypothetical protein
MEKKTKYLLIILQILTIGFAKNSQKYLIEVNTSIDLNLSSLWLIQSYKKSGKTSCLVECNLKSDCYTVIYSSDSTVTDNCALYSKYFNQSEFISLENMNLYSKECN